MIPKNSVRNSKDFDMCGNRKAMMRKRSGMMSKIYRLPSCIHPVAKYSIRKLIVAPILIAANSANVFICFVRLMVLVKKAKSSSNAG